METDSAKTSASKNQKQKWTRIKEMDNRKRKKNLIAQRKPYTTRTTKIQGPKEEEKTYSDIYKEEWAHT